MRLVFTALAIAAMTPGPSLAWRAFNGTEVNPVRKGVFEVIPHGRSGPQQFWCGAGDYARQVLGVSATQRIYIWRGLGPSATRPGKKSVQFSLTPPPGADTSPTMALSYDDVGDNLRAAMSQQYCFSFDHEDRGPRRP